MQGERKMSKYLKLYERMCPNDPIGIDDPRRDAIIAEMQAVIRAATNREAANEIEWWSAWSSDQALIAWVIRARKIWNKGAL